MSTRTKLIIFFGVVALSIFILGLFWASKSHRSLQAAEDMPSTISATKIDLLFSDHLDTVNAGAIATYDLKIFNKSDQDLNNLRVYGYLALPSRDSKLTQTIFPDWLIPKSFRKYPSENYFSYLVDLKAHSWAKAKIPVEIKKFETNQDKAYSDVYLQLIKGKSSFWNIFRLEPGYSGPIIAVREDTTTLE